MKFKKEFLQELSWKDKDSIILTELIDTGRWTIHSRRVFEFEGKFYETFFSEGATECQEESPYEYDDDEIECKEVFKVEKTVIVYE